MNIFIILYFNENNVWNNVWNFILLKLFRNVGFTLMFNVITHFFGTIQIKRTQILYAPIVVS